MADKATSEKSNALERVPPHSPQEQAWVRETERAIARLIEKEFLVRAGHSGPVNALAFSPDGTRLASASSDKTVILWEPRTGCPIVSLKGHERRVNALAFSSSGAML